MNVYQYKKIQLSQICIKKLLLGKLCEEVNKVGIKIEWESMLEWDYIVCKSTGKTNKKKHNVQNIVNICLSIN